MGGEHSKQFRDHLHLHHEHVKTALEFLESSTFSDAADEIVKMITVPDSSNIAHALQVLQGSARSGNALIEGDTKPILCAPVMSKKHGTDVGLVDVRDLTQLLCKYSIFLRQNDLDAFAHHFFDASVTEAVGIHPSNKVLPFQTDCSLLTVAEGMFRVGTHRAVGVADIHDAASPIISILTQTELMRFMCSNLDKFEPEPNTPIREHFNQGKKIHTIKTTEPAVHAFEKMQACNVSAVAVVDADGKFINSVSASNVRLLNRHNVGWLLKPVTEFLDHLKISQSDTCTSETSFADVVETFKKFHLHRMWVVDKNHHLVSVLTVGDFLRRFYDNAEIGREENLLDKAEHKAYKLNAKIEKLGEKLE